MQMMNDAETEETVAYVARCLRDATIQTQKSPAQVMVLVRSLANDPRGVSETR